MDPNDVDFRTVLKDILALPKNTSFTIGGPTVGLHGAEETARVELIQSAKLLLKTNLSGEYEDSRILTVKSELQAYLTAQRNSRKYYVDHRNTISKTIGVPSYSKRLAAINKRVRRVEQVQNKCHRVPEVQAASARHLGAPVAAPLQPFSGSENPFYVAQ